MDSSDSEDCQLYTRAAENVRLKQELIRLPAVVNYNDEEYNSVEYSPSGGVSNDPEHLEIVDSQEQISEDFNVDCVSIDTSSETPLPKRRRYTKSRNQKKSKKRTRNYLNKSNNQHIEASIVLDDDKEFGYMPPINFNSQYTVKHAPLEKTDTSLNSTLDKSSNYEGDNCVILTVEWNNGCSSTRREFKLNKYDKLDSVFQSLSELEGLTPSRVILMHNFTTVHPDDTPHSLNISFYGALTGSLSSTDIDYNTFTINQSDCERDNVNSINVKMQMDSNETVTLNIMKNQQFKSLFKRCSQLLKCQEKDLRITFDGENVKPDDLVSNLDIENDDVLHVYKK